MPTPAVTADATTAESDDIPTRLGLTALRPICAGKVADVPREGAPPSDVAWAAFASRDGRTALGEHFDALFGKATHLQQGACDSWRFPPQRPTSLVQVCDPRMDGPWITCGAPPAGSGAVLIVSELAGGGAR